MKTKTFEKKLSLNKNTVARLNDEMMHNARGGEISELCTGPTGCMKCDTATTLEITCD